MSGHGVGAVETKREIAARLRTNGMGCNCDLDNWEPERDTGHSWVCRIHKAAVAEHQRLSRGGPQL